MEHTYTVSKQCVKSLMRKQTHDTLSCAKINLNQVANKNNNNNNNNNSVMFLKQSTVNSTHHSNFMQSRFSESQGSSVGRVTRTRLYYSVIKTQRYRRYPKLSFGTEINPQAFTVGKGALL